MTLRTKTMDFASPWTMSAIALPLISVVAGALIHRFSWFSLIAVLWCVPMAGVISKTIREGRIHWRHGRGVTDKNAQPISFWSHTLILCAFYLFATALPLMNALQESQKLGASQMSPSQVPEAK